MCQQVFDVLEPIIGDTHQKKRTALSKASGTTFESENSLAWVLLIVCNVQTELIELYFLAVSSENVSTI